MIFAKFPAFTTKSKVQRQFAWPLLRCTGSPRKNGDSRIFVSAARQPSSPPASTSRRPSFSRRGPVITASVGRPRSWASAFQSSTASARSAGLAAARRRAGKSPPCTPPSPSGEGDSSPFLSFLGLPFGWCPGTAWAVAEGVAQALPVPGSGGACAMPVPSSGRACAMPVPGFGGGTGTAGAAASEGGRPCFARAPAKPFSRCKRRALEARCASAASTG